jgi:hypothetical protein
MSIHTNPPPISKIRIIMLGKELQPLVIPTVILGLNKEKRKLKFPCNIFKGDHLIHTFHKIEDVQ